MCVIVNSIQYNVQVIQKISISKVRTALRMSNRTWIITGMLKLLQDQDWNKTTENKNKIQQEKLKEIPEREVEKRAACPKKTNW